MDVGNGGKGREAKELTMPEKGQKTTDARNNPERGVTVKRKLAKYLKFELNKEGEAAVNAARINEVGSKGGVKS